MNLEDGITTELTVVAPEPVHDILVAEFSALGAHAFSSDQNQLVAWFRSTRPKVETVARSVAHRYELVEFSTRVIVDRNWNELWEKSLHPVTIGSFHVRPSFATSTVPPGKHTIVIDPKMSFGTGYHETTRLVLSLLDDVVEPGDEVIDVGTGTGILAVAAIKKGAGHVNACDTDPWAIENAIENLQLNECSAAIELYLGGINDIPLIEADVVLANVNKAAIVGMLPDLRDRVRSKGTVILSGFLTRDKKDLTHHLQALPFEVLEYRTEGDWLAIMARCSS